jgi:hypothetical protein
VRPAPTGRRMPPVVITVTTGLMAFGHKLPTNPEMPERLRRHSSLNRGDLSTYYRACEKECTDHPTLKPRAGRRSEALREREVAMMMTCDINRHTR